jgi:hypothetical protein
LNRKSAPHDLGQTQNFDLGQTQNFLNNDALGLAMLRRVEGCGNVLDCPRAPRGGPTSDRGQESAERIFTIAYLVE